MNKTGIVSYHRYESLDVISIHFSCGMFHKQFWNSNFEQSLEETLYKKEEENVYKLKKKNSKIKLKLLRTDVEN